jgi:hypothetical protein
VLASCDADGKPKRIAPELSELLRGVLESAAGGGAPSSKG